jgi:adenylate cyclase
MLGSPDAAQRWSELALARTRDHPHALSRVIGLTVTAVLEQFLGRARLVQEHAEAALALAREHGFSFWAAAATILSGWAGAAQGRLEEGLALMRDGLAAHQATGRQMGTAYFVALVGEGFLRAGLAAEGLALIAEVKKTVEHPGYFYRGELERLRGELLLRSGDGAPSPVRLDEAEACFRQALDTARQVGLRALELRAGLSLARVWIRLGRPHEARALVDEIYRGVTEGFETADLREAHELLAAGV